MILLLSQVTYYGSMPAITEAGGIFLECHNVWHKHPLGLMHGF